MRGGFVALAPKNHPVLLKVEQLVVKLNYTAKWFDNAKSIEDFTQTEEYGGLDSEGAWSHVCFGVSFNEYDVTNHKYDYNLHYNVTGRKTLEDCQDPRDQPIVTKFRREDQKTWKKNMDSGIIILQHLVEQSILKEVAGSSLVVNARVIQAPVPAFKESDLWEITNGSISLYIAFPIIVTYLRFVYFMLYEKEQRIAQNLKNMGMSLTAYYASWILFYSIVLFCISLVWTLIVSWTFFAYSNKLLVFLVYFVPALFFLSLGFFLSAFFTKSKPGVLAALVIFFVIYGGNIGIQSVKDPAEKDYNLFAISPLAGLERATANMVMLEASTYGFSFANVSELIEKFRYSTFLIITIAETVLFFLLGIYFDQVYPTEIGVKKHWLFCLKCDKKRREMAQLKEKVVSPADFEAVDQGLLAQIEEQKVINIKDLSKVYENGKKAVDRLNLTMFSDQIFALLGHNGAGKTTTISMISGLLELSNGSITILGHDSNLEGEKIKKLMGICPQVNPIFDSLSVFEHLELYAKVKTVNEKVSNQQIHAEIIKVLQDIDLIDKKDFPAGKLSGGQKRKLCVAISFIGNSKVVLLDEPTSGMDTYARRHLWEMLKNYKKNRIIILTTHYMDEADYLGDRIGIMGEGNLITCGSSLFLKNRFGCGYDLTVVKLTPEIQSKQIVDFVQNILPSAKLAGDISMEIKFQLPTSDSSLFEPFFRSLDDNKQSLGIQSYGISLTTLEEVFLKVASGTSSEEAQNNKEIGPKPEAQNSEMADKPILPSALKERQFDHGNPSILDGASDKKMQQLEEGRLDIAHELQDLPRLKNIFWIHFFALVKKRVIYFKRDYKGLVCEILLPILVISLGLLITLINFIVDSPDMVFDPKALQIDSSILLQNTMAPTYSFLGQVPSLGVQTGTYNSLLEMDDFLVSNDDPKRLYSVYFESFDLSAKQFKYTVFLNNTASFGANIAVNLMNQGILKAVTNNPNAFIKSTLRPHKLTKQWKTFESSADALMAVFLISLAYSFIPSSLIMFIVKERETNVKHQQIVSGVSILAYWSSNFTVDFLKFLICGVYTCLAVEIFNIEAFKKLDYYGMVWALTMMYGVCVILFTYLTSFLFKSPSGAQIFTFIFNYFTGFILMLTAFIFRLVKSTRPTSQYWLEYPFRLFPSYNYSFGLLSLPNGTVWQAIYKLTGPSKAWTRYGAYQEFVAMIIVSIASLVGIYLIENQKANIGVSQVSPVSEKDESLVQDSDVLQEEIAVSKNSDFQVKVENLKKTYSIFEGKWCMKKAKSVKQAVKGISFGVGKGECFGLLGTNGAGKSTTFKILTGEIFQTAGLAQILGCNLETDIKKIIHKIGYCPQFDALLDNLTSREHLELYAAIKGIPVKYREQLIQEILIRMNLKKFENVLSGTYSGGNKRKLSVAMALLGSPPIIFLDEPSSGMDPEARRFMWSIVAGITGKSKQSSVILTTHSMEEAEALSTKLAIMVEGSIKCIGSVQRLKNKYGKGFEIETKIAVGNLAEENDLLKQLNIESLESDLTKEQVQNMVKQLQVPALLKEFESDKGAAGLLNVMVQWVNKDEIEILSESQILTGVRFA